MMRNEVLRFSMRFRMRFRMRRMRITMMRNMRMSTMMRKNMRMTMLMKGSEFKINLSGEFTIVYSSNNPHPSSYEEDEYYDEEEYEDDNVDEGFRIQNQPIR